MAHLPHPERVSRKMSHALQTTKTVRLLEISLLLNFPCILVQTEDGLQLIVMMEFQVGNSKVFSRLPFSKSIKIMQFQSYSMLTL